MTASNVTRINFSPLPTGFEARPNGDIHRVIEDDEGNRRAPLVCSELHVLALTRDRSGAGWGRLVEVIDSDGNAHVWAIPARMFAGDGAELRAKLLDLGLYIAPGPAARYALADLLQRWRPKDRALSVDRLGWSDETCRSFVLGNGQVIGDERAVFQAETVSAAATAMVAAGDLADWRGQVAALCTGNPLMVAAVSLAFAGPLLEPLGLDGGGLHLRGASSSGKSTIQRAAASVWGGPAFLQSWRATANGLEALATACNGSMLALDEMGEVSGREAAQAAYMIANGIGKARADRTGAARPQKRWRTMVLSSGEICLTDKMAEDGRRAAAGQNVRLLDVSADAGRHGAFDDLHGSDAAAFADRIRAATATAHGTAGPAFVAKFLDDPETAKAKTREAMETFRRDAVELHGVEADGQTQRAAARLGLIAAAGELATIFDLTGWPRGAAHDAAMHALGLWIDGRGGVGPAEAREAIERVRAFLVTHGEARFERLDYGGDQRPAIPNRAGWREGQVFFIATDAWREVHRGADPQRAARYLHDAGYLECGDGRNLAMRMSSAVPGRPRAYAVPASIMGADNV